MAPRKRNPEAIPGIVGSGASWPMAEQAKQTPETQAARTKQEELNANILGTFSTPAGKKVLEWLWSQTVLQPVFTPRADGLSAAEYGFWRGGQNDVVMSLQARMEMARKEGK